jgi:hypothetical protein
MKRPTVAEAVARLYARIQADAEALWEAEKKPRKPSIPKMVAAAEKTGKSVTSITLPDGTVLHFGGSSDPVEANAPLDKWLAKHHAN